MYLLTPDGIEIRCPPYDSDERVYPEDWMACPEMQKETYKHTFCNRIITQGRDVCIVKDTCAGCAMDPGRCAITDMLEQNGTLESWRKWDFPNFRERERR